MWEKGILLPWRIDRGVRNDFASLCYGSMAGLFYLYGMGVWLALLGDDRHAYLSGAQHVCRTLGRKLLLLVLGLLDEIWCWSVSRAGRG